MRANGGNRAALPRLLAGRRARGRRSLGATRERARWLPVLASSFVLLAGSAAARTPLPHTPAFAEQIDAVFYRDGLLDHGKVEAFRAGLSGRLSEVLGVYQSRYRADGRGAKGAAKKASGKKLARIYARVVGDDQTVGLVDELLWESDPVRARLLAGRLLELDYALRIEGELPFTLRFPDYLLWMSVMSWSIETSTRPGRAEREAVNLWDPETKLYFTREELAGLVEAGEDLSRLNPPPASTFWRDPGAIASRSVREVYYAGGDALHEGIVSRSPGQVGRLDAIRKTQTKPKLDIEVGHKKDKREFKLKTGAEVFSEPTVNSLLATLGFNVDVTHHVKDFKLYLDGTEIEDLREDWRSYFEDRRNHLRFSFDDYLTPGEDDEGPYLMVREAVFEERYEELTRVGPWAFGELGNDGLREVRGLALFSVWVGNTDLKEAENNKLVLREQPGEAGAPARLEIFHVHHDLGHSLGRIAPEQLNALPWDLARVDLWQKIRLNYHSVQPTSLRNLVTHADARWMGRHIAQLRREQIAEAVSLGGWPGPAAELLVEKLISRRNDLVKVLDLEGEPTPSGPIALLPVDRELTTADGAVVDGELVTGQFEGSTQEFANYWEFLLDPVFDVVALELVAIFQRSIGEVFAIVLDPRSVGIPTGLVSEVLVTLRRELHPNPNPSSAEDYYFVQDDLRIGLRVGGGYVLRGETTFFRRYSLIRTAGTEKEGRLLDNHVLNLALPYQVSRGELPETFTLVRENYVDVGGRVITDDLSGGAAPVGVTAGLAFGKRKRSVVTRKEGFTAVLQDTSHFAREDYQAFVKIVFVRIPFLEQDLAQGDLSGNYLRLSEAELEEPELHALLWEGIRSGHFDPLLQRMEPTSISTLFDDRYIAARLLSYYVDADRQRSDLVTIDHPGDANAPEQFFQYRSGGKGHWVFLDFGEDYDFRVQTVSPVDDELVTDGPPTIVSHYRTRDRATLSRELRKGELDFINGVAARERENGDRRLIPFTPEWHSTNDRWGYVTSLTRIGYSSAAVQRLLELDADEYWSAVAVSVEVSRAQVETYRQWLDKVGRDRLAHRSRIPAEIRRGVVNASHVWALLLEAREKDDPQAQVRKVVDALVEASIRNDYGFDARVLAALHQLVDPDEISIDAQITQPPWIEKRLLGGIDLEGHTHEKPFKLLRPAVNFEPGSAAGYHGMLDDFSE